MKIAIIGGGASGLTAAIAAARKGVSVTVFEKNDTVGRKILATGNGKCNLSNTTVTKEFYNASDIDFVFDSFDKFGTGSTVMFFNGLGLLITEKKGGLYPHSEQAASVLDALRNEAVSLGVVFKTGCRVNKISVINNCFKISYQNDEKIINDLFDRAVITAGGKAGALKESEGNGYDIAKSLGHSVNPLYPALTGLKCEGKFWKSLAGVRTGAKVTIFVDGKNTAEDSGELQLTDYGISGIPVFQVSRFATTALGKGKNVTAVIDFMPSMTTDELVTELKIRELILINRTCEQFLNGFFNKKITALFLRQMGVNPETNIESLNLSKLADICKNFKVRVVSDTGFEHAQVTAGGIPLCELDSDFQSKLVNGLYFAGEILDVDGLCGGYNLQWAWTSGHIAGEAAARA